MGNSDGFVPGQLKVREAGKLSRSARSGGPKSSEGKAISSRNALNTGVYSTQIILPGESEEEFRELEQQLFDDFRPEGVAEAMMVHDLAVIAWKKRRLMRIEHVVMMGQLQAPISAEEFFEAGLPRREEFKWALENLDFLNDENLEMYERHAVLVKGMGREEVRAARIAEIQKNEPVLFERLSRLTLNVLDAVDRKDHDALSPMVSLHAHLQINRDGHIEKTISDLAVYCERIITEQAEGLRYAVAHLDQIRAIGQIVKDKRHLALVGADGQSRAMDDLNRAFYRTLKELRSHQEWGRRHRVIDVVAD